MREMEEKDLSALFEERLKERREVLDAIENIFRLGKGKMETREELSRIEQVRHFDSSLARKAFQDPRLFARDPLGRIRIQRMYDKVPTESMDTYENRFALFLLHQVSRELESATSHLDSGEETLPFLQGRISYGRYGTISLLRQYVKEKGKKEEEKERRTLLLRKLQKKALFLLESDFARNVSLLPFPSVEETNLLTKQKDFRLLLSFYRKEEKAQKEMREALSSSLRESLGEDGREEEGTLIMQREGRTYQLQEKERVLTIKDGEEESEYQFSLPSSLFLPELLLRHGKEERRLPLLEKEDFRILLFSLTFLIDSKRKDICPICSNPLKGEDCPFCHAEVHYDEKGRFFVKNVPFIHIGG